LNWLLITACNISFVVLHIQLGLGLTEYHFGVFAFAQLTCSDARPDMLASADTLVVETIVRVRTGTNKRSKWTFPSASRCTSGWARECGSTASMALLSLLLPVAVNVAVQRDIASLGTREDRDRLLLVMKRGGIRFRVLLCEVMLLGHVEVRDHLPPIERRHVSREVADDGKLIAEDGFAALHSDEAAERLLLLLNRGGCDVAPSA
jgi:hypothetical protein